MSGNPITPSQFYRQRQSLGVSKGGPTSPFGVSFFQAPPGFFLLVQKEMGWNRPRVDVGIDPYEGDGHVSHVTSSDRPSGGHLPLKGKALGICPHGHHNIMSTTSHKEFLL